MARAIGEGPFEIAVSTHVAAIRQCIDGKYWMPALVLIYCGIDTLANLSRPAEKAESSRADFIAWCEKYMECQDRLEVSGVDLYGARCGVVHAYSSESSLSASGKARPIMYSWGSADTRAANALVESVGRKEIFLKIEYMFEAFLQGLQAFANELDADPQQHALVEDRSRKLIIGQPSLV
jgi:hypothetical protein